VPLTLAVLDANVLVPVSLVDTLLRSAEQRRYAPLWSDEIFDEVIRNVARLHPEHGLGAATRRAGFMKDAFPDAMVTGWQHLEAEMTNDPKDRHVLAAAVVGGAEVIVTNNVLDFPDTACHPYGIAVMGADAFLCEIWSTDWELARTMIEEQAGDLRDHGLSSVLDVLAVHLPNFIAQVRVPGHSA
jgi:predicted nucleic acid-binding protein